MTNPFSGVFSGADTSPLTNATAYDRARADEFYRRLALLQQQYEQQLAGQGALGRAYDQVIAGTAPSVAGTQLQRGLGQTRSAVSAEASGASGENAALANYGAIQALAAAQTKQQQDAAMLRAKEVADARAGKASLLNQMQGATGNMAGITEGGGVSLTGQAGQTAGQTVNVNEDEIKQRRALLANLLGAGGAALIK